MNHLSFVPKASFTLMGRVYTISNVRQNENRTEIEAIDQNNVIHTYSQDYVLDQYEKGNLKAITSTDGYHLSTKLSSVAVVSFMNDLDEGQREEGVRKANFLAAIAAQGGFQRGNTLFWKYGYPKLSAEFKFPRPPNRKTISRWIAEAHRAPEVPLAISLMAKNSLKGGKGKPRMSADVLQIVETCAQDVYLSSTNTPIQSCHEELVRRIQHENQFRLSNQTLKLPSYGQLRRYLNGLDAYDIYASRFGRTAAETHFRLSRKDTRKVYRALERVEIDHTPLDIFIVDDDGAVLGRAYLTLVVDKATRAILGFNLGLNAPSQLSALLAISHAIRPKTYLREKFPSVQHDWPMCGLFELLAMDNGSEFHAFSFVLTIQELGLAREIAYMPRRLAYYKGLVETLQKYLNLGVAEGQPGSTMSHHWQRNSERPPEQYAVHTLHSLNEMLHIWICDIYHPEVKKALGMSVYAAWKALTQTVPVRLPVHQEMMELACTLEITRKVQHYGVEVCYLRTFNNEELGRLRRKYMHVESLEVQVRYKPHLLDRVWVKYPDTHEWFVVENYDDETCNSNAWLEQQIHLQIRNAKQEEGLVIGRAEAREKLRQIGKGMRNAKTMAKRRRALQLLGLTPTIDLTSDILVLTEDKSEPEQAKSARRMTPPKSRKPKPKDNIAALPKPRKAEPLVAQIDYTALQPLEIIARSQF